MTNSDLDSLSFNFDSYRDKNYLTHNFHPYPAKFVPQIPRALIEVLSNVGDTILDPFCGSGTSLVECKILNRNAIGIDVNPIAVLSSKVKTTLLSFEQLKLTVQISKTIASWIPHFTGQVPLEPLIEIPQYEIPSFLNKEHWFKVMVQEELAAIRYQIDKILDIDVRNLLLLALSSIITRVSNQDSETRYAFKEKKIGSGDTISLFCKRVEDMIKRMSYFKDKASSSRIDVRNQDSRDMNFIQSSSIQAVITSPPYLNTYDYYLYHRLRMYWLGFNPKIPQDLEIGSRNKHSDNDMSDSEYYDSISNVLEECYRVLKPQGYLSVVIGDAILKGQYIEMDTQFREMAQTLKFTTVKKVSYQMSKYTRAFIRGKQKREKLGHIIIFKNGTNFAKTQE